MGDGDAVEILQCLGGFPKGQAEVHMHGQAQPHDVGVEGAELQGGSVVRKGAQVDFEEVDGELPVDVVELIKVLRLVRIIGMDLLQTVQVVGTLLIHTLVHDEELPALDRDQGVAAEGASEDHVLFDRIGVRKETVTADLAEELAFITVVLVEVDHGSTASGAADVFRTVTGFTALDGLKLFTVFPAIVFQEIFPVPVLRGRADITEEGRLVHPVFLVFGRMGIIKGPLPERDISADKRDQPAVLLIKVLT